MSNDNASMAAPVETLHAEYWTALDSDAAQLIAYHCTGCGTHYLPKAMSCVRCGSRSFERQALSPQGTLYAYSIVYGAGGVWPAVYTVGYVDFPEGVRVFGQLRETSQDAIAVGATVGIEPAVLYRRKDGTSVRCFRFYVARRGNP